MNLTRSAALATLAGTLSVLASPPALVLTGQIGSDLSADGQTAVGTFWNAALGEYVIHTYTRGVGAMSTGSIVDNDPIHCSADGMAISFNAYDLQNVAGLGTDRYSPRTWTLAGGETNFGKPPTGTSCDAFTFNANDISGNGRYVVGGGYTLTTCGTHRAARLDTLLNVWEELPVSTSPAPWNAQARATRADAVSADGTVIVGYDENYADASQQQWRGACVWVKNGSTWTQTILDRYANKVFAVSADGNTLVGKMSPTTMQATFGTSITTPVRWTRSGNSWIAHNMGGEDDMLPTAVSADGSTIVGTGGSDGSFIWRANLNGGVPKSLPQHVADLGGSFPGLYIGSLGGSAVRAVSADGNTLLISTVDEENPCLVWSPGAILCLNGAPCEPANIVLGPVSHYNPDGPLAEPYGMTFNCFVAGSWPMTIQWQQETGPGTGVWTDLVDDNCDEYLPEFFNFRGTTTMQLRIGGLDGIWSGRYRCVVTNDCGTAISGTIRAATCYADYDCNGFVNGDDFDYFVVAFEAGDPVADIDGDGFVSGIDFDSFADAFIAGC